MAHRETAEPRVSAANVELVARLLGARGPLTRSAVQQATALSRPTVSGAVASLLAQGRVEEETVPAVGRGRPSTLLRLSRRRIEVIGLEIGRGHVAVAAADPARTILATDSEPVDASRSLIQRARTALRLLDRLVAESELDLSALQGVMIGTPGPRFRDRDAGGGDFSLARLDRERAKIIELVEARLDVSAEAGNNTRFTALAQAHRRRDGLSAPVEDLVYLRVDEGVGGGLVIDGALAAGAQNAAGEFGHVSVDPLGERCPCGGRGCLELTAGLPALLRATGCADVIELTAASTEPGTAAVIQQAAVAVGSVLAGVVATANPSLVVIGGVVADLPDFLTQVELTLRDLAPAWARQTLAVETVPIDHLLGAAGAAAAAADLVAERADAQAQVITVTSSS